MIAQNQINKIFFQIYKTNYLLMYRLSSRNLSTTATTTYANVLKKNETMTYGNTDDNELGPIYLNKDKPNPHKYHLTSDPPLFADKFQGIHKENPFAAGVGVGIGNTGKLTMLQGLQEFLQHPMTWDRNNGFINLLLGLALFGYCFCSFSNDPQDKAREKRK